MYATCTPLAPCSASHPPTVTMTINAAISRMRSTTIAFVILLDALSRLGYSRTMLERGRSVAMVGGPYNPACEGAPHAVRAGVVELVDTPALGAGGASLGGSSPSARIAPEI